MNITGPGICIDFVCQSTRMNSDVEYFMIPLVHALAGEVTDGLVVRTGILSQY